MKIREFLNIFDIIVPESIEEMKALTRPHVLCGRPTPDTINDLSFGQLVKLQQISGMNDLLFVPAKVLMGIQETEIMEESVERVVGFSNWCAKEVKRVNELFAKTSVPPTEEEKKAGIERMNFGVFGLIDYYAQRMGITDHEEVEAVPWVRIYKCLDMDAQRIMFGRRLRNIQQKKK